MFLEPGDVRIVWDGKVWLIRTRLSSRVQPFMSFDVSIRKGD